MVIEILSYKTSFLNPLLKLITPLLFVVGTYYFFRARKKYGGVLRNISDLLLVGGIAGLASSAFRYAGDWVLDWKWGESTLLVLFGIVCILVAYLVRDRLIEAAKALGTMEVE